MSVTDPPYNVRFGEHGGAPDTGRKRKIQNDDIGEGFYDFLLMYSLPNAMVIALLF